MTKIKYVGLFAMLPLLTVALSSEYIQDADARPGTGGLDAKKVALGPYFDLVDVQPTSANSKDLYNVIVDVFARLVQNYRRVQFGITQPSLREQH